MRVYKSVKKMMGARLMGENPLPLFRDRERDTQIASDGSLRPEELEKLGYETGFRVLPYCIQDRYSREKSLTDYPVIVLENDRMRAEFLASYGGRLISLYDKEREKELLFCNPVFQPANLAIRNAWFSGGIEWNVAQLGHTYGTCDPVFFAKQKDAEGQEFLRMYNYERSKGVFWQIDFHLPEHCAFLFAHIKIINDKNESVPMYWWTNTAIREEKNLRVFSGTKEVIYLTPESIAKNNGIHGYGHSQMPYLPPMPGVDASYPLNSHYTNEFFFQNSREDPSPWEAAAYEDGFLFMERSTQPLRIRKMFCWGSHAGGRNWQDFLAEPGKGAYVEIQAGLCPTQVNGMDMEAHSVIEFTQAFGSTRVETQEAFCKDWEKAAGYVNRKVDEALDAAAMQERDQEYVEYGMQKVDNILFSGQGWGYLEQERRKQAKERPVPLSMRFSATDMGEEERLWHGLLKEARMPCLKPDEVPRSWMTDPAWEKILGGAIEKKMGNAVLWIHLGVLLYENGRFEEAMDAWQTSLGLQETAVAYRNLAFAARQGGRQKEAYSHMEKAFALERGRTDPAFAREYLELLLSRNEFEKMWRVYTELPPEISKDERLLILVSAAALELRRFDFLEMVFACPFSVIREGENQLCELWFRCEALKEMERTKETDLDGVTERIRRTKTPPLNIDYRLV